MLYVLNLEFPSLIHILTRSLIPERDPVASLGINGGMQMEIPCYVESFSCHSLDNTICMMGFLCKNEQLKMFCEEKWNEWQYWI